MSPPGDSGGDLPKTLLWPNGYVWAFLANKQPVFAQNSTLLAALTTSLLSHVMLLVASAC